MRTMVSTHKKGSLEERGGGKRPAACGGPHFGRYELLVELLLPHVGIVLPVVIRPAVLGDDRQVATAPPHQVSPRHHHDGSRGEEREGGLQGRGGREGGREGEPAGPCYRGSAGKGQPASPAPVRRWSHCSTHVASRHAHARTHKPTPVVQHISTTSSKRHSSIPPAPAPTTHHLTRRPAPL
jgi:hypothetical protein